MVKLDSLFSIIVALLGLTLCETKREGKSFLPIDHHVQMEYFSPFHSSYNLHSFCTLCFMGKMKLVDCVLFGYGGFEDVSKSIYEFSCANANKFTLE